MNNVVVLEAADDMGNGVALTDVGEELIAKAFALARAGNQTGDEKSDADTKVDGDASDTTGLKQVKVGDKTLCEDTTVDSNTDDWSGYREDLAKTGMAIGGVLLSLIAFGGVGVTLLGARRRTSTVKHGVHAAK